ncbi:phage terminase small subunit [Paenibacillus sp. A3]|uniref:phage terminase small subunit n=1 Tax=Paenibacillus sp. A3 TaxID=1337054 RepID=UPI0006D53226|nr:phage terminase small subunit [Paenibacillus sp. A3]
MGKERDPNRDRAAEIWREHDGKITNRQIAEMLGVDEKKIAVWKQRDKELWSVVQQGNNDVVQHSESSVVQRKKIGAPKGNKNAVGNKGGAPKGNQNAMGNRGGPGGPLGNKKAVTTGEYEAIWLDALQPDEQELIAQVTTDPIQQADEAITLLSIRERRMLQRIQSLMEGLTEKERRVLWELKEIKDAVPVRDDKSGVTKTVPVTRTELVESQIEEKEYRKIDDIIKLEEALTRVQDKKLKAIELKNRFMDEEKQLKLEKYRHELNILKNGRDPEMQDDGFLDALKGMTAEVWDDETEA